MTKLQEIKTQLNNHNPPITLVAVSKTQPIEVIRQMYDAGHKIFGENRVQELEEKYHKMPKDIEWHFIGHLQTNKVKYIAPFVHLIHGVDSFKLLKEINKQAAKNDHTIDCLLQMHIAEESSKFGFDESEVFEGLQNVDLEALKYVRIVGVMGMATYTDDISQIKREFGQLRATFEALKSGFFEGKDSFKEISMGMSGDYELAIEAGSTMVRIGSLLFGKR